MATTSFTALRRLAGFAFMLTLLSLCLTGAAVGQGSPLVTASSPAGLNHPTGWNTIEQTTIDANGDWLVEEYPHGGLFEFPANGGSMITLVPLGEIGNVGPGGDAYWSGSIFLDPAQNLYIGGAYSNCLLMFPFGSAANPWPLLASTLGPNGTAPAGVSANLAPDYCSLSATTPPNFAEGGQYLDWAGSPGYFQPWAAAAGAGVYANSIVIAAANSGNFIFSMPVSGAWANPVADCSSCSTKTLAVELIGGLKGRPISVAVDPAGNVYFTEDYTNGKASYNEGVFEIPAGETNLTAPSGSYPELNLPRVDPNLPNVTGVVTDAAGNLYISDGTDGVFMVPNASPSAGGTPQTSAAVMLSPVPAQGEAAIDPARKILYVPTTQQQSNGQADVAKLGVGYAEFGSSPVKQKTATATPVDFSFNGTATPVQFVIEEPGAPASDFGISGGTCTTGTAYAANTSCYVDLTMTPNTVGSVSAKLLMENLLPNASGTHDSNDTVTAFTYSATGTTNVLTLTANSALSAGQTVSFSAGATDPLYPLNNKTFTVLAAGLSGSQFEISTSLVTAAKGNSTATVTGYHYTTIASVLLHGTGVGANAQVSPGLQSAIGSGLATPTQVATDAAGNVYVADPGLGKVLMYAAGSGTSATPFSIGSGLTSPTGVAIDGVGDVYIADSGTGKVYEVPYGTSAATGDESTLNASGQVLLVSGLGTSGLNLAADGLGDLYIADPTNAHVVKLAGLGAASAGALAESQTVLTGFTAPSAVAVDSNSNLYVVDGSNLFEFTGGVGAPTTVLNTLSGATGVAVDPSGAVYISSPGGTVRIPYVSGALVPSNATAVASDVSASSSVALDRSGNLYVTPVGGPQVTLVSTAGILTLAAAGSSTTPSTSADATVTNIGNAPLSVSGYSNSSAVVDSVTIANFTGADGSCVTDSTSPGTGIAAGATCQVDVTFDPGPGQQGTLTGWVEATSNAINAPITIDTAGTAVGLSGTKTTVSVASSAQVISTPVTVTVDALVGYGDSHRHGASELFILDSVCSQLR